MSFKDGPFNVDDNVSSLIQWLRPYFNIRYGTDVILPREIDLPGWNMQTTDSIVVPLGNISFKSIRETGLAIFNDFDTSNIVHSNTGISLVEGDDTGLIISREAAGIFDDFQYSDDTISRGKLTLWVSR